MQRRGAGLLCAPGLYDKALALGAARVTRVNQIIAKALDVSGFLIIAGAVFWGLDLPIRLGLQVYTEQFLAAVVALVFFIAYLRGERPGLLAYVLG